MVDIQQASQRERERNVSSINYMKEKNYRWILISKYLKLSSVQISVLIYYIYGY